MKNSFLSALGAIDVARRRQVDAPALPAKAVIGFAPATADEVEVEAPALRPFRPDGRVLESQLPGVSNEAWTDFVLAIKVADLGAVSDSNALGMFGLRYKRLADLGLVTNVRYRRGTHKDGLGNVQEADWVEPLSRGAFLASASLQYRAFAASMQRYFDDLRGGLAMPEGASVSGSLAILHRGGRRALERWGEEQFEQTRDLFRATNGVF